MADSSLSSRVIIQNFALPLLLLLYLLMALAHAVLAPLTTGPDELAHYEYVRFIADHGRLPGSLEERGQASYKSDQPPLYHLIAALPVGLVDPSGPPYLKRVSDHPRRQLIERTRHAWGLYNTEDEQWPYRGEVLRWQVGRWVSILFGAATVAITYYIALEVFGNLPALVGGGRSGQGVLLALGTAAVVAFIPRYALTGSMLNYETTLAFFSALFLWKLLQIATGRLTAGRPLLLGLFLGLAITTKLSALILPLEVIVALWLIKQFHGWAWSQWLRTVAITGVMATAAVSWWYGFILVRFNSVARDGLWVGLLRPLIAADSSDATTNRLLSLLTGGQAGFTGAIENLDSGPPWAWLATLFRTFWVVGIEGVQPLGRPGLLLVLALCLLAAYGLGRVWRRAGRRQPTADASNQLAHLVNYPRLILSLLLLHLGAAFVLPLVRYTTTLSLADTAQGRHILFLTAPAFAVLLVWGVSEGVTGSQGRRVARLQGGRVAGGRVAFGFLFLIPGLFLLLWSGVQLWTMSWAYLPPLPVSTRPEAKAQAGRQLDRPLNEYVTLAGYSQRREGRMLRLDLLWQATAVSPVDFLSEVSLLNPQDEVVTQWLGYPAEGRYPTRAWDVGDLIGDTIWLPLNGLEPGDYRLQLNLIANTVYPPPPSVSPQLDPPLTLASVRLDDPPESGAADVQIWQRGQPVADPQSFRYRETILATLKPGLAEAQRQVQMVGSDPNLVFEPRRELGDTLLFQVGPDWPSGDYSIQISPQEIKTAPLVQVFDRWQRRFDRPEINRPVEANFANQVKLLGYELGANRAGPGGGIPLTLYWQGLDWMGSDYTIFVKMVADDQTVRGGRDRLPQEGYRTLYWAPGEVVVDPFGVPVDEDAPDGVYYLNIGLFKLVDGQAVSLPLVQNGQTLDATSVNLGPVKIGHSRPEWTVESVDPQNVLNQPFGDGPELTLLGYDWNGLGGQPAAVRPGEKLSFKLYWRSESPLSIDYTTFVHIRNEAGETVAQKDRPPLGGVYPTSLWDAGEIMADEMAVPLPPDLPAGSYRIVLGLYDFRTGVRLAVPGQSENEVVLTTLELAR